VEWHELAHWIGFAGEVVNFVGASVLALDLILRRHEFGELKEFRRLKSFVEEHGIEHAEFRKVPLRDPDFTSLLIARRASRLGLLGVAFLGLGFCLLGSYHLIEIWHGS
jgi:hypothetical protein